MGTDTLILAAIIMVGFAVQGFFAYRQTQATRDIAAIQRAIFLQLRREFGEIDQDLEEIKSP